ncbi:unannotated protein [freshwater metagenome]|uniref:Unannotated protein n=1 Tax=freshwater metagenome TaxID=449393 RepID=A0A6J6ARE4_9ZZZZ
MGNDDGNERRRKNSSEYEVVQEVRGVVRKVVRLGECGGSDGVGHDADTEKPGQPAETGAKSDHGTRAHEVTGSLCCYVVSRATHRR